MELALPCNVKAWVVAPTVKAPVGVMVLSPVAVANADVLVMSELAPLAAAPRLVRAPPAVEEFVPPLAIGNRPVKVISPLTLRLILPLALTATVPLALGMVMDLLEPAGVVNPRVLVKPPLVELRVVEPLP